MCNSKRVINDKQNSRWRPTPFWIYYYCQLVTWPISGSGWLQFCKIVLTYINLLLSYYHLCESPKWRPEPFWILFLFNNVMNFGPITTTVSVRILCMLTYLSSGHVTFLRGEFQPQPFSQSDLRRQAASRWALPHISRLISSRDLGGPSADRHEILLHGRKRVQFTNVGPKIWGSAPQKNLGAKTC